MAAPDNQPTNPFLNDAEVSRLSQPPKPSPSSPDPIAPKSAFSIRPATPSAKTTEATPPKSEVPPISSVAKGSEISPSHPIVEANFSERRPGRYRRWLWIGGAGLVVMLIAGGVYWWWSQTPSEEEPTVVSEPTPVPTPTLPVVEDAPVELLDDTANYRSENFKIGEIVLLGEAEFLQSDEGIAPLTLDSIRGEAFTEKNKQEVKLVITWNTNKLATAEVSYAKGIGQSPKVVETGDYAYDHSLILTGLDPASTYLYTIKAIDRFGNVITSEPYAVFTGARSVSLFDLIAGAIGEVFGWAVK